MLFDNSIHLIGNYGVLWVVWLGASKKGLYGEQDGPQGHGSSPLVLQDVQTDGPSHGADVRVPDLRLELDLITCVHPTSQSKQSNTNNACY